MYLFNRRLRLAPGSPVRSLDWGVRMTEKVNAISESEVTLWAPRFSAGASALSWTTVVEDLGQLDSLEGKLLADEGYLHLVEEGATLSSGDGLDDGLVELIHLDPDAGPGAEYVAVVTAVAAAGQAVRSIEVGIEISTRAKAVTGFPTSFGREVTGPYGGVGWFTLYPSIEALQQGEAATGSDEDFIRLVDEKASTAYAAGSGLTTIWRKVA